MFAQCSNCDAVFRVNRKQLDAHDGLVRCGRCREVFNAAWNLVDELPASQSTDPVVSARDASLARSVSMAAAAPVPAKRVARKPSTDEIDDVEELAAQEVSEPEPLVIETTDEVEPEVAQEPLSEQVESESDGSDDELEPLAATSSDAEVDGNVEEQEAQETIEVDTERETRDEELAEEESDDDQLEDNMLGEWAPVSAADDQLQLNFGDTESAGVYPHDEQDKRESEYAEQANEQVEDKPRQSVTLDEDDAVDTASNDQDKEIPAYAYDDMETEESETAELLTPEPGEPGATEEALQTPDENLADDDKTAGVGGVTEDFSSGVDLIDSTVAEDQPDDAKPDETYPGVAGNQAFESEDAIPDPGAELEDVPESEDVLTASDLEDKEDAASDITPHAWRPDPVWRDIETANEDDDVAVESDPISGDFDDLPCLYNGEGKQGESADDIEGEFENWDDARTPMLGGIGDSDDPERETPVLIAQEWYDGGRQEPKLEPVALDDQDKSSEVESDKTADIDEIDADLTPSRIDDEEIDDEIDAGLDQKLYAENTTETAPEPVVRIIDESVNESDEYLEKDLRANELYNDPIENPAGDYNDSPLDSYDNEIDEEIDNDLERQVISDLDPEHTGPFNPNDVDWVVLHGRNPLRTALWGIGCLLLLGMLVMQVRSVHFDQLAAVPDLRPYLVSFCKIAACDVPTRRDARRIELSQTRVTLHPENPGALRIAANLTNLAAFAQPFPALQLTLTDKSGRIVGRRVYQPVEYLGTENANTPMPKATPQDVVLDLAQPHETAVGFELAIAH